MIVPRSLPELKSLAYRTTVFSVSLTIAIVWAGGFHYLSTTENLTKVGDFTYLGLFQYPFVLAIVSFAVGVSCELVIEYNMRGTRRRKREEREEDGRRTTMDVIEDRNEKWR